MVNINLEYNNAYKWYNKDNIYIIGHIYFNNKFYRENEFIDLLIKNSENIVEFIKKVDGNFTIVLNKKNEVIIISDIMRTFPVFYSIYEDDIYILDNIKCFKNKEINSNQVEELKTSGYIISNNTIFNNIYQIEANQIVKIDKYKKTMVLEKYFDYKYNFNIKKDTEYIKKLDDLYNEIIVKTIKYLNGRKVIIPLSGGNDSRQIAYYLKKNNYTNVICYTYGSSSNSEVKSSKKVAEYLGYEWYFVEYKNKSMQKKFNNIKEYGEIADYCGRGYSVPIIQEWEAIDYLIKNNIINKNCVVIPGFSGDFLDGSHIHDDLYLNKDVSKNEFINSILKYNYSLDNNCKLKNYIENYLNKYDVSDYIKIINSFEKFDFEERQVKYITNAIRIYEYYGLEWYIPFWDKKLINMWLSIPLEKRYKLNLFNLYTKKTYGDLMEYAPIYKKIERKKAMGIFKPVQLIYRFFDTYKNGFLNFYGYFYFRTYILYFFKTKQHSYIRMFAEHYINYIKNK